MSTSALIVWVKVILPYIYIYAFLSFKFVLLLILLWVKLPYCPLVASVGKKHCLMTSISCLVFEITLQFKKQQQTVDICLHFHLYTGLFEDSHRGIHWKGTKWCNIQSICRKANNIFFTSFTDLILTFSFLLFLICLWMRIRCHGITWKGYSMILSTNVNRISGFHLRSKLYKMVLKKNDQVSTA